MTEPTDLCRILVVDDDPAQLMLTSTILKKAGYDVAAAGSGEEAIRVAGRFGPDLILLDVVMADIDGIEVCRRMRARESLSEVHIFMVTGLADRDARLSALDAGADDLISKPFDAVELVARVRTVCKLNRYRRLVDERDKNTLLLSELHAAYNATLAGWSRALELRDRETEGHTQRVANITIHLARAVRIPEEDQVDIYRGALLHDIGKIGVPDRILHKEDSLTAEETATMRRHPTFAYEMLHHIDYLEHALEIPYCHHERWDGTGYPRGLEGEEIPIGARIFAIADVWDALTVDRPYRKSWSAEKTLDYIVGKSGTHFDPDIVERFVELVHDGTVTTDT